MHPCHVVVGWSDGSETTCYQDCDSGKTECYAHEKYFTKVTLADGKEHWQMSPAYQDRLRENKDGDISSRQKRHITAVYSPRRDVMRRIGHEYDDDLDIAI